MGYQIPRVLIARGRRVSKPKGEMNKLERAYGVHLSARLARGEIAWFEFGACKLKLADKCWYEPDFLVMLADGTLEIHETKGFMETDAAAKLRMVAGKYWMFRLVLVTRSAVGGFQMTEYTKPASVE